MGSKNSPVRLLPTVILSAALSGCGGAPSLTLVGAFFPAWLACGLIGILAAIVARAVFVATGLSGFLPFQLSVCLAIGAVVASLFWLVWVGI